MHTVTKLLGLQNCLLYKSFKCFKSSRKYFLAKVTSYIFLPQKVLYNACLVNELQTRQG